MTRVTGRVALPYGRGQATTPVCGQVRYSWLGGVADLEGQVLIPGVAVARIIDGVVEDINLSPGRWLPVLVVDGRRYDLPEIIVEASDTQAAVPPAPDPAPMPPVTPAPTPEPSLAVETLEDGGYTVPGAAISATADGEYVIKFDGARHTVAHTGDGNYEMKES